MYIRRLRPPFLLRINMRKLTTPDVFNGVRLLISTGMKTELKALFMDEGFRNQAKTAIEEYGNDEGMTQVGFSVVLDVIGKFAEKKCEEAFYQFLTGPFEMNVEDIKTLPLTELIKDVLEVADIEEWMGFFTNVTGTLGIPSLLQSA